MQALARKPCAEHARRGRRWAGARALVALGALLALAVGPASGGAAAESWLDQPAPAAWNLPGGDLPVAPPPDLPLDPRVLARERAPESPEEEALAAAGWRLFAPAQAGWGVRVVQATRGYDGMGRPWGYQVFVFVDGAFAGTLAPTPMDSRTDGALDRATLTGPDSLAGAFRRYAADDPLCCPTGDTAVQYQVERSPAGPVVTAIRAATTWPRITSQPPPATSRFIVVDAPTFNAPVASGFQVRGRGSIGPFESTLAYRVYDEQARIVGSGPILVEGEMGQPFTFRARIAFTVAAAGHGWLEIAEPNAAGGPDLVSLSVPLTLTLQPTPAAAPAR